LKHLPQLLFIFDASKEFAGLKEQYFKYTYKIKFYTIVLYLHLTCISKVSEKAALISFYTKIKFKTIKTCMTKRTVSLYRMTAMKLMINTLNVSTLKY